MSQQTDDDYCSIILEPLRECMNYRPAFGQSSDDGVSLAQFHKLFEADPLYRWIGLDSDLMYAAHKAAGGMTSIYRQLGIGCERLLREIVHRTMSVSYEDLKWSYEYPKDNGGVGIHYLDLKLDLDSLRSEQDKARLTTWLEKADLQLQRGRNDSSKLRGVVLEIRQGYKSADSKRQNADLRFGMRAYNEGLLPAICIVSSQVSEPVIRRYKAAQMLVLVGLIGDATESTYGFFAEVVGYDLAAFFERNAPRLRQEFSSVLTGLLTP